MPYYYRCRIRNAADSADALVVTSVPSGTNPFISAPPSGDGQGFNPRTGATEIGAYTVRVADNGAAANVITGFLSDGNGRYDKLGRRAYLEYGTDGTTFPTLQVAGYVTAISYPSAAEAQVTIGEAQRTERVKQAFSVANANFPATTMLAGGPVRWPAGVNVTPINFPDRGPWTVSVTANDTVNHIVNLLFVSGWVLPNADAGDYWHAESGAFPPYQRKRLNALTATEQLGTALPGGFQEYGNCYADLYQNGSFVATVRVLGYFGQFGDEAGANQWINVSGAFSLEWTTAASVGDQYQVYVYSRSVNESSPLHILLHPVDIVTGLITDAGELWDTTSAAAVRASIGADVRLFLRLTSSEPTDAAITRYMGLFGFGRRINAANVWEFFDQRTKPNTAPATQIFLDDLREMPTDVWALEDSTILNTITVVAERFALWAPGQSTTRPPDSLVPVEQRRTARFQLADGTFPDLSQGTKELTYSIQGTILNAKGAEIDLQAFTAAIGAHAFDRWGYGAPRSGFVLRTNITAQIGDEILTQLSYLPNANVRGGQRIVQIVQRTNEPGGPVVVVEDSGATSQPALAPTFSIALSVLNPRGSADIALTNAAALVTAGVQAVLFEWIVSVGSPSIAGQDLGAIIPAAPSTLTTPQAAAGSTVWARAKSIQPGRRAGAFTAWASVSLTGVGAPSTFAFTANPTDGSAGTLSWVAGGNSATYAVRVLRRPTALGSVADAPVATLLPGSVAALLTAMTPGVGYTATVQYVDATTGTVAASASFAFTAGASTLALAAPVNPVGIVGSTDIYGVGHTDGTYGLDVTAVQLPGVVEFWEAIETGVGTRVYGTAVPVFATQSVSGGPTSYRKVAPNDGLLRSMTARHVATGATPSAYTTAIAVNPWGAIALPSSRTLGELGNVQWTVSGGVTTVTFARNGLTDSVWAAAAIASSSTSPDFATIAAAVSPLAAGATSFVVPTPTEGQVTLVQLEPRHADLTPGIVRRLVITATSQLPSVEYDDSETKTVGTQWIRLTERGFAVVGVQAQTQLDTSLFSAFAFPTRGPGAASVVRGGTLGPMEYEQDVPLSAVKGRQTFIRYQWTLVGGQTITSPDFAFDAGLLPNILSVALTNLTVLTLVGDSDVKSWYVRNSGGDWERRVDGQFAVMDVAKVDDDGSAGLAANTSNNYGVFAFNVPAASQLGADLIFRGDFAEYDLPIYNGTGTGGASGSPTATWAEWYAAAPTAAGLSTSTLRLRATSAPVGWVVKVFARDPVSGTEADVTASLSPTPSTVPTVLTSYVYTGVLPRLAASDSTAVTRTLAFRAELRDGGGIVQDAKTLFVQYLAARAFS